MAEARHLPNATQPARENAGVAFGEATVTAMLGIAALASVVIATPCAAQLSPVEEHFEAAAKARDFKTMRALLVSPVELRGNPITADEFLKAIADCDALNAGGGMMGWTCPGKSSGKPVDGTFLGGMRQEGGKVKLFAFGYLIVPKREGQ